MPRRLTEKVLGALKPRGKPYEIADAGRTGLLVRVQPTGTRWLYATYKVHGAGRDVDAWGRRRAGTTRRVPLGNWPAQVSLAEARAKAVTFTTMAREGKDPEPAKTAKRERQSTLAELVEEFLAKGTGNADAFKPRLNVLTEKWGKLTPERLTRGTFTKELWRLVEAGEQPAARTLRDATRALYNWINARYDLHLTNPADVKANKPLSTQLQATKKRYVAYTDKELQTFWRATEEWGDKRTGLPGRHGLVARLAMLTGGRSDLLGKMEWSWVQDDAIHLPPQSGRKRMAEWLPITPGIRAILDQAEQHRRRGCEYVFWTRTRDGDYQPTKPSATDLKKRVEEAVKRASNGKPVPKRVGNGKTVKELRHTAIERMEMLGVRDPIIDAIVGHTKKGIRARYSKYQYREESREALEKLEVHLMGVVNGA